MASSSSGDPPTAIERAFVLARSGECSDLDKIERQLISENFDDAASRLADAGLRVALRQLCMESRLRQRRRG